MRLAFVQFGNYAEAAHRFANGGAETFYAQQYSVNFVASLAQSGADVTVLHLTRDDAEERLPSGVRSVGVELFPKGRRARHFALLRQLRRLRPDHLILASPLPIVLAWALASRIRLLPLFADSFQCDGIGSKVSSKILAMLLNRQPIEWVANHNLAASLELVRIGVEPRKVVPWDWPALISPADRSAKTRPSRNEWRVLFVGQVTEAKGVGELIDAMGLLRKNARGLQWRATIAGGQNQDLAQRANAQGVTHCVDFIGRVPHASVVPLMNEHDVVVVPSRPEYPEGLPMSIYEAFCSRTPLVTSDHPMFRLKVHHQGNALVFRAGDPAALATALERLSSEAGMYERLSQSSEAAAAAFFCPLKGPDLISRWLSRTEEARRDLASYSLASGRYLTERREPSPAD